MSERTACCAAMVVFGTIASGCSQLKLLEPGQQEEARQQVTLVDEQSSYPAIRRPSFEQLNLIELIDPHEEAKKTYPAHWAETENYTDERKWGVRYDLVLAEFRESRKDPEEKRQHRNSVQDRILGVSTSRCNVFKTYLRRQQTEVNFWLGSAATVAGVLGAILPGVRASKNLAGTAGMLSGVQAEYNQQYFAGLAAHVIVQGIETRQGRMLQTLVRERQGLSVVDYSMEAAIKDAILFDGSCSTITGLSEASDAIRESTNPGLPRAAEVITGVRALREITQTENFDDLAGKGRLQELIKLTGPSASPLVVSMVKPSQPAVTDKLATASQAQARIEASIATAAASLQKAYGDALRKLSEEDRIKQPSADKVALKFTEAVNQARAPLPVAKCVAALATPAGNVGSAAAKAAITPDNSPQRLQANAEVDKAKADASLATGRVELLVNAATSIAQETLARWLPAVVRKGVPANDWSAIPRVAVPAGLAEVCS